MADIRKCSLEGPHSPHDWGEEPPFHWCQGVHAPHNHDGEPKVWCVTHQHEHIASMPEFTYMCKFCAWGAWHGVDAKAHEDWTDQYMGQRHETYPVHHLMFATDEVSDALRRLAVVKAVIESCSPLGEDVPADLLREALGLDKV